MQLAYLLLAILGLALPYSQLVPFVAHNGLDLSLFWSQLFTNDISSGFAADVLVSSVVFWLFVLKEAARLEIKRPWLYVFLNLIAGLSFALPLFLMMRLRKINGTPTPHIDQELSAEAT